MIIILTLSNPSQALLRFALTLSSPTNFSHRLKTPAEPLDLDLCSIQKEAKQDN